MWQILMRMALPALIKAIEGKIGKEAMDVMQAAILAAASSGFTGDEKRAVAWAHVLVEWRELKLAVADEVAAGIPWVLNLAFEALVARTRLAAEKAS